MNIENEILQKEIDEVIKQNSAKGTDPYESAGILSKLFYYWAYKAVKVSIYNKMESI